jgi:WD repeat-containing protein 35
MDPGLTAVQILDYSLTGHINLEADIRLPEPEGLVQVETFGVSINSYGTCFYGLQLEAVMDRCVAACAVCMSCCSGAEVRRGGSHRH